MSGVFGIVDPHRRIDAAELAGKMVSSLSHFAWHVAECQGNDAVNAVIGRIGIGSFNPNPQPVWNESRTVAICLAGEFYSTTRAGRAPAASGARTDEEQLHDLYARYGLDFACSLEGAFVCVILDLAQRRLVLANDRFAFYPTFYSQQNGRLVFAPEMQAVLQDPVFKRRIDLTALAQSIRFQQVLGERTFFEDLRMLPPAGRMVCDLETGKCTLSTYWSFADIADQPNVTFGEAAEEGGQLLRAAVRRLGAGVLRPGVFLSGGLDSRVILGMLDRGQTPTFTYGPRHARDVIYAAQIARACNSRHHWFDLPDGRWVLDHVDQHLTLTEGYHSWIHSHGMHVLPSARPMMDVLLTGWDGGTVLGDSDTIEPLQQRAVDDAALTAHLFDRFNQDYTWPGITETEERLLYTETLWPEVRGLAFDSFRDELKPYLSLRPDVRSGFFYIRHHCGRLTHNMVTMYRSHFEVRFPFFDYALFDFLYSLPVKLRAHKALFRAILERETPRLARIPYDHDDLLPTSREQLRRAHALSVKVRRRLGQLWPALWPARATLYADYETYLRNELRPWAENLLFDPRLSERGLFDPRFVRTLLARHVSGLEQWTIGKIAPIMTYEMMLRRFMD